MVKVSIITPFYNPSDQQFVISSKSVEAQTSRDFEWILVDDGSNLDVDYEYDIKLNNNYGPSVARNAGFQISSGRYITYLDMGDELNPNRVENLIRMFEENKSDLIFSAYYLSYPTGHSELFNHFNFIGNKYFPTAFEYVQILKKQNFAIPLGVAHTRKPFVEVGGFQRGIVCGEDGILWRRMVNHISNTQILFSDDIAGTYFVSGNGQSRTQRRFEMGGFAFNGNRKDNGAYLDDQWFETYSSEGLYD